MGMVIVTATITPTGTPMADPLLHLMQLVSPALPVGAYAYSQGQEYAVDQGWVTSLDEVENWIAGVLRYSVGRLDLPVLWRLLAAAEQESVESLTEWDDYLSASRESAELLLEDRQMGEALWRLLSELQIASITLWPEERAPSFATGFAVAAKAWGIAPERAMQGFGWSWLENQVAAAIKLVPLGQTDGQRLQMRLMPVLEEAVASAMALDDNEMGAGLPGLAMASARHETQYSRLFRS